MAKIKKQVQIPMCMREEWDKVRLKIIDKIEWVPKDKEK